MNAVEFTEQNRTLVAPGCGPLPVHANGRQVVSCWQPSAEDLQRLCEGGKVWLSVLSGETQPPVWITTEYPFLVVEEGAEPA